MKINLKIVLILVLLAAAFFVRVYRVDQILGFYYDQGRDGLVIWDLIHNGKFFLIGPTTGIAGVFRGPFYYYLIAPFYLIGNGNPIYPSIFLVLTSVVAIALLYPLGPKSLNYEIGIFAVILAAFSYRIVMASRWLSNPTPMLLLSVILLCAMFKVLDGKKWAWPIITFTAGLSLFHFGSAGEVFYFPAILIFAIWQHTKLPDKKNLIISIIAFIITFLPLVLFDLKHGFIESRNIQKFLFTDKSFALPSARFIQDKLDFFSDVFSNKIFISLYDKEKLIMASALLLFVFFISRLAKSKEFKTTLLVFVTPLVGLTFFQGNFGNIYDYYLTGYYLIFILLIAALLGILWTSITGKVLVVIFLYLFLSNNLRGVWSTITDKADDNTSVAFVNQKKALDWVYTNAGGKVFDVDVYVPPVIPYAYDYLFQWLGNTKYGKLPSLQQVPLLYTLYEVDTPHPERLDAWLARQKGIGKIESEQTFGGITVQRRTRI